MSRLKVGVIGAGFVSRHHLLAWRVYTDRVEIAAICDPNESAARQRAEEFQIPYCLSSAQEMLSTQDLDAVDICAPRELHPPLVADCAARGLGVLCQKPLATSAPEAERLIGQLPTGARVMVHENWRFRPYYRLLKDWVTRGLVGDVRQVRIEYLSSGLIANEAGAYPALERQPMFAKLRRFLVMEILIHHLDTLRYLLGELRVRSACLSKTSKAVEGEDAAALTLERLDDGIPIFVLGNLAVPGLPGVAADELLIVGTRGAIRFDGTHLSLVGAGEERIYFDPADSYQASYTAAIGHFISCLASGSAFETSPQDNINTLRLVEDAYRMSGFERSEER